MASGFLIADTLSELLRKPYHKGDLDITVQYLVEGLKLGEYRVMLKRNYDTACWIPPMGKRGSHSIYYGDRMLGRIVERFVKVNSIEMPEVKKFTEDLVMQLAAEKAAALKAKKPFNTKGSPKTLVLNSQIQWLKDNLTVAQWELFGKWLLKAVASYGRHEREHARQTPRDLKVVNRDLRLLGIPFMYFNLFEDARIESWSREELDTDFEWMLFEELAPMDMPVNMFLRCIQLEGKRDTVALDSDAAYKPRPTLSVGHIAEQVEDYYARACKCNTTDKLYPIIMEFLEEFRDDLKPPPPPEDGEDGEGEGGSSSGKGKTGKGKPSEEGGSGSGADDEDSDNGAEERAGDLSTAADAAEEGESFFDTFDSDAEVVGGTDDAGKEAEEKAKSALKDGTAPKGKGGKGPGSSESIAPQTSGGRAKTADFLAPTPGKIDDAYAKRVDNLTNMLMRMFKTHSLPAATESPGQRLSSRHLARGELKFIHKKVFGGKGKRKFSIIYDCSGSMSGKPDREGKLFLLALNNLAKRGFLEGSLILTGWVEGRPGWLAYPFPVKEELILSIQTNHGSEGIQDALKDNLKIISNMDDVFVYTDAQICDSPLDRAFFARKKIWPVGLYVGSTDNTSEMERHFPQNIIKDSIEILTETLLTRNRRTVG